MKSRLKPVDATQGIRELTAELIKPGASAQLGAILFCMRPGKSITLINPEANPPLSTLVGPYGTSTLRYTTRTPQGDPAEDHHAEIVRDHNGRLFFRENRQLPIAV